LENASYQSTRNKASSSKNASHPLVKKKEQLKEGTAPAIAELDDDEQTNIQTISTAQLCEAIADVLTSSLEVCHRFIVYTMNHDGVAAANAAETAFVGAQKDARSRAQRKRKGDLDLGDKGIAPSKKPKNK
jgi:hypothetical protein